MASLYGQRVTPFLLGIGAGNVSFSAIALDASGDKIGQVYPIYEAATITHCGFRYGVRTGTPPTYKIGIQGVDASGLPDGTYLGGGTPASATFTPPADATWNSTWQWIALDNSIALTRGQAVAMVIEHSSGTVDGSNNSSITRSATSYASDTGRLGLPYALSNTTGSWAKMTNEAPVFGIKSASTVYGHPLLSQITTAIGTNGHRAALKYTLLAGNGDTYKIRALRLTGLSPAGANWIVGIWDAAGTAIHDRTLDGDISGAAGSGIRVHEIPFDDANLTGLSFGTTYYLGIERVTASCELSGLGVNAANDLTAWVQDSGMCLSTWDGAAWSDTDTTLPFVEPVFADITEPTGGGVVGVIGE